MKAAEFRRLALSFPEAFESKHVGHPDFRVRGKIFATLGYPDEDHGVVILPPDWQRQVVEANAEAFSPVKGFWGQRGATKVRLEVVRREQLQKALEAAWRRIAPKLRTTRRSSLHTRQTMKPLFFAKPEDFRAWLEKQHASATELWVGFHRKATGRASITWPESVDEALGFGWIDGIRKSIDESSYMIRFTPRKKTSTWSLVNIGRVAELTRDGRMRTAGAKAFAERAEAKSGIYAYEQRKHAALDAMAEKEFRRNARAWKFFQAQAPSYRKVAAWWVISAKQEATRRKRLARLINDSEAGRRLQ